MPILTPILMPTLMTLPMTLLMPMPLLMPLPMLMPMLMLTMVAVMMLMLMLMLLMEVEQRKQVRKGGGVQVKSLKKSSIFELRPYTTKPTASRPICAVKQLMAESVLWWGTTWEYSVL